MPRIIAGKYKGRLLVAPKGDATRPTQDRVKESLFSILGGQLDGQSVIDLFAGTGGLGLEALSRGASNVVFVENGGPALKALRANISSLGVDDDVVIMPLEVERVLPKLQPADLILMDAPYAYDGLVEIIEHIFQAGLLNAGGLCVVETSAKRKLELSPHIAIDSERRYGDTKFLFLRAA